MLPSFIEYVGFALVKAFITRSFKNELIKGSGKKTNINTHRNMTTPIIIPGYFTDFSRNIFPKFNDAILVGDVFSNVLSSIYL